MESQWMVEANGKTFGPFTTDQLVKLAQSGQIQPFHMVRKDGGPLVACAEVKGLFDAPGQASGGFHSELRPAASASQLPPMAPAPMPPAMAQGYYAAPSAQYAQGGQQFGAPPSAYGRPVPTAGIPATQVPTGPSPMGGGATTFTSGAKTGSRKSSSSTGHNMLTVAAILIGAAAAILIYINLEPLEKRIRGSGTIDEPVVVAPSPPGPRVVSNPPAAPAEVPNTNPNNTALVNSTPAPAPKVAAANNGADENAVNPAPIGPAPKSVTDAGRSIVQLRTPIGPQPSVISSGFAVDDRGMIATTLSTYRPGSTLKAYFPNGSTADVIGFVAVAAERDLVLLKLSAVTTAPLPQSASGALAGTRVFAAGANLGGGSSFTSSNIDISRRLTGPIQGSNGATYLADGTYVATLRSLVSSASRGGPVMNDQGELLGVLSISPNRDQYVIDRRHVAELIAGAGDIARPLSELDSLRATAIALNPAPPRRFFPAPAAQNAGPVQAAPALAGNTSDWIRTLDSIYSRRDALVSTREQAQTAIKPLIPQAAKLQIDYQVLVPRLRLTQADFEDNERRIAQLTVSTANDPPNSLSRNNLAVRITERSYLRSRFTYAESEYNEAKAEFDAVKKQIDDYNAQLATVYKEADTLRKDFLTHLDPFGAPSKERGAEGVKYFSDKIPIERDSSFAYLGRASSYLLQGENRLAIADLDAAVKTATEKSIFLTVRGVAHARLGDLPLARKDLNEAIRYDDKNYWCRFQYCLILCRTEAFTLIEQQLRECMKLDPASPNAFTMMALLKATADDKFRNADYALRIAQSAYELSATKAWDVSMAMAAAYAEKGDFDKAVEFAEKAVAVATERQAAWCKDGLKTFQEKKPLRVDWKTFDFGALL